MKIERRKVAATPEYAVRITRKLVETGCRKMLEPCFGGFAAPESLFLDKSTSPIDAGLFTNSFSKFTRILLKQYPKNPYHIREIILSTNLVAAEISDYLRKENAKSKLYLIDDRYLCLSLHVSEVNKILNHLNLWMDQFGPGKFTCELTDCNTSTSKKLEISSVDPSYIS